ncbi:MAG: thiamine phosphate synthase [Pseudomonadota bacterium]
MTYAKALKRASQSLCGYAGASLSSAFFSPRRSKRGHSVGWFFLGPQQLQNDQALDLVRALAPDIGLVIRSYGASGKAQVRHLMTLAKVQRRICLLAPESAAGFGRHIPRWQRPQRRMSTVMSMSVHSAAEAIRARRSGADLVFISPVFDTQSHVGAPALGLYQARRLARMARRPAYALGGLNNVSRLRVLGPGFAGFAGISGFSAL